MPKSLGERLKDATDETTAITDSDSGTLIFSTNAGAPGGVFVTLFRLDSAAKHLYIWDGTQYVKVSDYA